ncbi:hypothetical protein KAU09_01645 [Candidatus Parcubacteria bacterium]|nr:hypothetical protein [Candidatus Parcubacteria bacterium]
MRSFFGDNFAIPMACEVLWDKIPHERMGFYKKFKTKEAGLFKANLSILKKIAPPIQMAVNY